MPRRRRGPRRHPLPPRRRRAGHRMGRQRPVHPLRQPASGLPGAHGRQESRAARRARAVASRQRHGHAAKQYYESGKIKKEMTFIAGQKEGKEISYNEDGSIEKEEKYRSGKVIN